MAETRLPNPNRYIIENDADGNSFFSTNIPASLEPKSELGAGIQRLGYHTDQPPVTLSDGHDLERYQAALQAPFQLVPPGGGANVWYNDIPPDTVSSPMHRTVTLDLIIVVVGEIELTLSSGETRTVRPGDMVVQRSTLHKWRNTSKTRWARMVAIASECRPFVTEKGEELGMVMQND